MLTIEALTYYIGGRRLFDAAGAAVATGHRVGLVGRNGSGKSTLLRLIAGELAPDSGTTTVHRRARIGTVAQEAPDGPQALVDFVLAADVERSALVADADRARDPARIADIHTRLADIGAAAAPARAARILAGLGFSAADQAQPLGAFSGGWRMRVALAATLFAAPDLLLLDEPSNHLDLEARLWLEGYLARVDGTVLLVSHDRQLLNTVVGSVLHLSDGKLTAYRGNYDRFEATRRLQQSLRQAQFARQLAQRKHMQAFVDRFRYKATKARQAQSRIKALARMEQIAPIAPDAEVALDFPPPQALPPPLITADGVSVGYAADRPVLRALDFRIDMDDRIALIGANGNGKTTLLRLLTGELAPQAGSIRRTGKLRIGYFNQQQADAFELSQTAYAHMAALMPTATNTAVRAHLGRFGLGEGRAEVAIGNLSGGEKAKLLFATVARTAPHILLLDEPTNHLDIDARKGLVDALNAYGGAVILVSHDPEIVRLCAERLWLVADGTCRPFDGDLDDYTAHLATQRRAGRRALAGPGGDKASRRERRRAGAASRAAVSQWRRQARAAEAKLAELTDARTVLQTELADPALYDGPGDALTARHKRMAKLERAIAAAEADWLQAQEALDGDAAAAD